MKCFFGAGIEDFDGEVFVQDVTEDKGCDVGAGGLSDDGARGGHDHASALEERFGGGGGGGWRGIEGGVEQVENVRTRHGVVGGAGHAFADGAAEGEAREEEDV